MRHANEHVHDCRRETGDRSEAREKIFFLHVVSCVAVHYPMTKTEEKEGLLAVYYK